MKILFWAVSLLVITSATVYANDGYPPSMQYPAPTQKQNSTLPPSQSDMGVYLSTDIVPLSAKERKALYQTHQWAGGGAAPMMGAGGKLLYVHGASLPTIIGSPMQVVDVELQQGENLHEIIVGDSARWMVETGKAGSTPHLFIKPMDAGIETSAVVTTNLRVYHLRLISQRRGYTPYVGFLYADSMRKVAATKQAQEQKEQKWATMSDGTDLSKLNFNYKISGDSVNWKPERVYDDGQQTFIRLPDSAKAGEMPVLLVRKNGDNVLVNYRVKDRAMVVDGIFKHIVLIVGVGSDQEKVEVRKK